MPGASFLTYWPTRWHWQAQDLPAQARLPSMTAHPATQTTTPSSHHALTQVQQACSQAYGELVLSADQDIRGR